MAIHKYLLIPCILSGDGSIGIEEYRQDCVKRMAYSNIKDLDDAFNKLAGVNLIHNIQKYIWFHLFTIYVIWLCLYNFILIYYRVHLKVLHWPNTKSSMLDSLPTKTQLTPIYLAYTSLAPSARSKTAPKDHSSLNRPPNLTNMFTCQS